MHTEYIKANNDSNNNTKTTIINKNERSIRMLITIAKAAKNMSI